MIDQLIPDMKKRLYTIGLFGKLTSQIRSKSQTLSSYGFKTLDQQILLCFFILRCIMEKTLQNEECLLEDIALFLLEANREVFGLPLLLDQCQELALLVLADVIGNGGEPVVFLPFPASEDFRVSLQYVDTVLVEGPGQSAQVSYRMVDDGFHLMLSTLEMEENMRLQFQDLIFQMQLKARNYARALDEIRQIFQLLKIREAEIEQKQTSLRSNAALIDPELYRNLNEDTLSLMKESRKKFEGYRLEVSAQQESLRRLLDEEGGSKPERMQELSDLGAIDSWLARSILSLETILNLLMEFAITYDEELKQQLIQAAGRRHSFRKDIYDKILEAPDRLELFDGLISSMFFKAPHKIFDPRAAYLFQSLSSDPVDSSLEEIDFDLDEELEKERREKTQATMRQFDEGVRTIMDKLTSAPGGKARLSMLFEDILPEADVEMFKQFLSGFASLARLDLDDLRAQANLFVEEERTSFNLPLSILSAMEENPVLEKRHLLHSRKEDNTFERVFEEDGLRLTVSCTDMTFTLE